MCWSVSLNVYIMTAAKSVATSLAPAAGLPIYCSCAHPAQLYVPKVHTSNAPRCQRVGAAPAARPAPLHHCIGLRQLRAEAALLGRSNSGLSAGAITASMPTNYMHSNHAVFHYYFVTIFMSERPLFVTFADSDVFAAEECLLLP